MTAQPEPRAADATRPTTAAALRAAVADHERRMLDRALVAVHTALLEERTRRVVAEEAERGMTEAFESLGSAFASVDEHLTDVVASRTFRSWAAVVGYDRRRRRRSGADGGRAAP